MIRKVEVKNFRILKDIKQDLKPFNILIGPNATGKSTFLDVFVFVRDILTSGLWSAVEKRAPSFYDLLWDKWYPEIKIAFEFDLPEIGKISKSKLPRFDYLRYESAIRMDSKLELYHEHLIKLINSNSTKSKQAIVIKRPFLDEPFQGGIYLRGENREFEPIIFAIYDQLAKGIQVLTLNSLKMRKPCAPGKKHTFELDGSNLPIMVKDLEKKSPKLYKDWIGHLQTALPFLKNIKVKIREEDRSLYLIVKDTNNRDIPSWVLSDGTLRILALTLLAYIPDNEGIYLIEEPENGIHPLAVETVYQSLSSVYGGQVLVATHSPVVLSIAKPEEILCFSRKEDGEAQIIRGDKHPALKNWKGSPNLSVLYASGVLD